MVKCQEKSVYSKKHTPYLKIAVAIPDQEVLYPPLIPYVLL